jgi:hypothetical protein
MSEPNEPDEPDGCDLDFTEEAHLTQDGEQTDAVVMFADCWDQPEAVERRRTELAQWATATGVA